MLNENLIINAKVVNVVSNRKAINIIHKSSDDQSKFSKKSSEDEIINKESKKAELCQRQRLNECLSELTRDYPYFHVHSFDIWSNEFIFDTFGGMIEPVNLGLMSSVKENKQSRLSISQVLTTATFANLIECDETVGFEFTQTPSTFIIESNFKNSYILFNLFSMIF